MKSRIFSKSKLLFLLGLSCFIGPLSSCSAFFGGDEYTITDTQVTTDENGDTIVTITFSGENIAPLTFTIPSVTDGVDGNGIANISSTLVDDEVTLTISYTDTTKEDTVITIPVVKGDAGKGISNVFVGSNENQDTTIQFEYTDGTTSEEITIPKGKDGVGIDSFSIEKQGNVTLIKIKFTDNSIEEKTIAISDGVSISNVVFNEEKSDEYNYVITFVFSDGSTTDITLNKPHATNWLNGIVDPTIEMGENGDFYLNTQSGEVFKKSNDTWIAIFSISGSEYENKQYYTVTFNLKDDEKFLDENKFGNVSFGIRVEEGDCLMLEEIPIVIKDGFEFAGWYASSDSENVNAGKFTNLTSVFCNINLHARWTKK